MDHGPITGRKEKAKDGEESDRPARDERVMLARLSQYLHREGANFEVRSHPTAYTARGVARSEHLADRDVAKVVVVHADDGYRMAVIPASRRIDMTDLQEASGESHLRLAGEEELARLFPDCEIGAMPPFGNLWEMPVWVDQTLADRDEIVFNAGNHHETVHMRYDDFECLVNPQVASFSRVERD